jgi:hypothetical protein
MFSEMVDWYAAVDQSVIQKVGVKGIQVMLAPSDNERVSCFTKPKIRNIFTSYICSDK